MHEELLLIRMLLVFALSLADAYNNYIKKQRDKLRQLPRGSKRWWKITNSLLRKSTRSGGSIPALRNDHGEWFLTPQLKADLFAEHF